MPPFQLLPTELFGLSAPAGNDKAVAMQAVVMAVVTSLASVVRSRMALQIEILALRHQLAVYHRAGRRPHLRPADRTLWA